MQIELQHTHDKETFEKNYKVYVELARDSAMKYGIPLTLDTPYNQPGIKSHLWVTQNIWGDLMWLRQELCVNGKAHSVDQVKTLILMYHVFL